MTPPPRILVIAGSDSSGGAGIQADIKTITMLGGYAMTAITAITAQNTLGVTAVEVLSPTLVAAQIDACLSDIGADAVKIGMLGSAAIAHVVADRLEGLDLPIVFDPVMIATSGAALADADTIAAFERLMRIATLTTPNVPELTTLGGDAGMAARGVAYLAKGGDAQGDVLTDRLVIPGAQPILWHSPRIHTRHTHGTGCTLASAIAVGLGLGAARQRESPPPNPPVLSLSKDRPLLEAPREPEERAVPFDRLPAAVAQDMLRQAQDGRKGIDTRDLVQAVERARVFVRTALNAAPGFGAGHGPMGHHAAR